MKTSIGTSPPRTDGLPKVVGTAEYADDFTLPGLWFGATVRSPHPHARVGSIRLDREKAPAGAVLVTAADLTGPNGVQLIDDSWPVLADGLVRHVGEAVALVAASTRLDALRARDAVEVAYTPLEPLFDPERAAEEAEPFAEIAMGCGDVEAGFAAAAEVVEGTYRTGHQEHLYIECQAMTAWWEEDGTVVARGSMQCPYYVHKSMVHALGLPAEKVRVQATAVGGGFGGKEDYPSMIALHAALLARAAGRPARLVYDRHEDLIGTTKRHPCRVRSCIGLDAEGRLTAVDVDLLLDGGAYKTLSPVVLSRAVLHAGGPYRSPAVRVRGRVVPTNTPPNGAFRGFGAPKVILAMERQMDAAARRLGLDPLEIRLRNVLEEGDTLPTGQPLDHSAAGRLCLETAVEKTGFRRRWRELEGERAKAAANGGGDGPRRGIGLSLYLHGAGFTGNGERRMASPVAGRIDGEGRLELATANVDMGQGCDTVFRQIACEAAGVAPEDVTLTPQDTARVPDSGPTAASRTTMVVGGTLARVAAELAERVTGAWAKHHCGTATVEDGVVAAADGSRTPFREVARKVVASEGPIEVTLRHEVPDDQLFDEESYTGYGYPTYAWGADVCEVEVDPDTLEVKAKKVTAVCEVGRVIHRELCTGQVEGGTLQSVGYALMEEVKLEEGRYLNDRLATYIIPTAKDSPELEVHLLERPWDGGPFGAKGVGELPMNGAAPAVLAAIENATGLVLRAIPATPEKLLACRRAGATVDDEAGSGGRG